MSVHYIYIEDGVKKMRPVHSREEYLQLRNGGEQRAILQAVRSGDESRKRELVQMNYSCLPNDDGSLKGSKRLSTTVGMDIDHVPDEQMQPLKERILAKKDELGLKMLEESARKKGYHLVFARKPELSQEENLEWASSVLDVPYDKGAKDITRVFFTTTEAELIYLDDKVFEIAEATPLQCYSSDSSGIANAVITSSRIPNSAEQQDYNGIPFSDIIAKYWELFNGGKVPNSGDRNMRTFDLALTLRSICGYNLERMMQVIPNYWTAPDGTCTADEKAEYQQTLANTLKEPRKGMPLRLKQVLQALKSDNGVKACGGTMSTPPPLPKRLPPLIKLLTSNVPALYKPAVASTVFPSLGAHLHGVKFRYWDNVEHEATFMNVLIGRQSIGKGSIKKPIDYIMADIKERDAPNRLREAEWKRKNPSGKTSKDPRPADICIQMLIDDLTDAVLREEVELLAATLNNERNELQRFME